MLTNIWCGTTAVLVKSYYVFSETTPKTKEGHEGIGLPRTDTPHCVRTIT